MFSLSCLIFGAKQIVQVVSKGQKYLRGLDLMNNVAILEENLDKGSLMIVLIE